MRPFVQRPKKNPLKTIQKSGGRQGGLPIVEGRYDRYCFHCGAILREAVLQKLDVCPKRQCGRKQPGRDPKVMNCGGFTRCARCDTICHVTFFHCELCGHQLKPYYQQRACDEQQGTSSTITKAPEAISNDMPRSDHLTSPIAQRRPSATTPVSTTKATSPAISPASSISSQGSNFNWPPAQTAIPLMKILQQPNQPRQHQEDDVNMMSFEDDFLKD